MRSRRSGLASSSASLAADGPKVREQAQALAKPEQPLLGPGRVGVGRVPLGPADGAEEDGVGLATGLERLLGEGGAVLVDRGAPDRVLGDFEVADRLQDSAMRPDDLGADAVAGQQDDR